MLGGVNKIPQRIADLGPLRLAVAAGGVIVGTLGAAIALGNAFSNIITSVPYPEVYIKSFVKGHVRDVEPDPRLQVKFRNSGGGPMVLKSLKLWADGKQVGSFREALGIIGTDDIFEVSTESSSFIQLGHLDRHIRSDMQDRSSIVLMTARPKDGHENGEEWDGYIRDLIHKRDIHFQVAYEYFHVPFLGLCLSETRKIQVR